MTSNNTVPTSSTALTRTASPTAASLQKILQQSRFLVMELLFHLDVTVDNMSIMVGGDVAMVRK